MHGSERVCCCLSTPIPKQWRGTLGDWRRLQPLAPGAATNPTLTAAGERGPTGTSAFRFLAPSALPPQPSGGASCPPAPASAPPRNPSELRFGLPPPGAPGAGASRAGAGPSGGGGVAPSAEPPEAPPVSSASAVGASRSPGGRTATRAAPPPSPVQRLMAHQPQNISWYTATQHAYILMR